MTISIQIVDNIYCKVNKQGIGILRQFLSYKKVYWKQGRYKKERKEYNAYLIDSDGYFLGGLLFRVKRLLRENNLPFEIEGEFEKLTPSSETPQIQGISFREDQIRSIRRAIRIQRGILKAPTGIGKTILALGIISCFPNSKVLFLVPGISLLEQTYQELIKRGFNDVSKFGGGNKLDLDSRILVSTVQSFSKLDPEKYADIFDIVIVDECDIGVNDNSQSYKILSHLLAPVRIGLSATLPEKEESYLYLEGLLGPVIDEMTYVEGIESGLLAKPRIRFLKTPYSHNIRELRRYSDVYEFGIVKNDSRNELIIRTAKEYANSGKSVLILVTLIEHGKILSQKAKELFNWDVPFIYGETDSEDREESKILLLNKEVNCVIANKVWRRGVNIPSLDVIINAAGEKSEVATIQKIGRGFRKTEGKDEFIIVDILDLSHHYLTNHVATRLSIYSDEGWL